MSYNKSPWGNNHGKAGNMGGNINPGGVPPFQPQFQGMNQMGLGMQQMTMSHNPIFQQQLSSVNYANTSGLNPTAFQNAGSNQAGTKQKVYTGTITKLQENFGFIDEDIFFPRNVCKGPNPSVGDKVLVEATFNPSMPFKWNATMVQVMARDQREVRRQNNGFGRREEHRDFSGNRDHRQKPMIGDRRGRSRDRDDDEIERKRRRDDRIRERDDRKSPVRRRSRSPKIRRRPRPVARYMVQIPKISLNMSQADLLELKKRYSNLYIPSDFFHTSICWVDTFPADKPYALNKPCSFHCMYKEFDSIAENTAILEPADADYRFSAKVMLMNVPGIEEIYQKCCGLADGKDDRDRDSDDREYIHPTRLINFLVGLRGKNETMAIGGPWSPSLDGENPENDPKVLIKTAIRTCKALTGIDLSNCTKWYRFVELYYRRAAKSNKGEEIPARVETVVIFLPDVWSCLPTRLEWEELRQSYRKYMENVLKASDDSDVQENASSAVAEKDADTKEDEKGEEDETEPTEEILEATHHSMLNPKSITVIELRNELKARNLDSKGLKSQLVARLTKALKSEAEKEEENLEVSEMTVVDSTDKDEKSNEKEKKLELDITKLDETQKRRLEKQYNLPEQPHLIVHPNKTAKGGKFDCTSMSLSLLLDYRPEDTKEHSFEVSLFAELFNEMLMRDFGFNIFKALFQIPEKPKEKEDDKKKPDEKKDEKKEEEKKEKTDEECKTEESADMKKDKETEDKKKDVKKDDRKSDSSDDDDDDSSSRKHGRDRKKKERVKLVTKDKQLLLSFVYFDQSHCGYLFDKDLEELLYTLGLNLSRSQIKKMISKAITRDSLHYRKLTDKPKDEENEGAENGENPTEITYNWHELAIGNRKYLPVFEDGKALSPVKSKKANQAGKSIPDDGMVVYQGAVVDIGKLLSQLDRSEKARIDIEHHLNEIKSENQKLSDKYYKSNSTIKHLTSEVKDYKEKLRNTEDALGRSNAHTKLFHTTLMDIRDKIEPVLKTASHKEEKDKKERDRENDKKRDRDDGKSRWEKDKKDDRDKKEDVKKEAKDKVEVKKEKKEVDPEVKEENKDGEGDEESQDVEMKEEKEN